MTRGKNRRLRLIPSHLPLIRDKLADFAQYRLRELGSQTQYEAMMANAWSMTDQIRTAQLWWVSRDMTRLAEDTVQAGDFPEPDPPAQCGMIFFEGDVQHISFHFDNDGFGEIRVAAILWQDVGREMQVAGKPFHASDSLVSSCCLSHSSNVSSRFGRPKYSYFRCFVFPPRVRYPMSSNSG